MRSFNSVSRRSEAFKTGSPESHEKAVSFIAEFLNKNWDSIFLTRPIVHTPYNVVFSKSFIEENKLRYHIHQYDLGCTLGHAPIMIVEVGDIGDDTKHNAAHKQQLINDGIAKKFIEQYFPFCKFYRINKEDSMYPEHLRKLFFKYGDRYAKK